MTNVKLTHPKFVPGTSRRPGRAATLLAQMADLERGARIRELREELHLTQPAVAERVHVTLRAYQEWEAGGGIQWENAKRLAKTLGSTPDFIMSGQRAATPDLSRITPLARIEHKLDLLLNHLGISLEEPEQTVDAVLDELEQTAARSQPSTAVQSSNRRAARRRKPA